MCSRRKRGPTWTFIFAINVNASCHGLKTIQVGFTIRAAHKADVANGSRVVYRCR